MSLLQMDHVSKAYDGTQAIDDLSLAVEAGEIVGLLGPNGAGKTTCVRLLTGVIHPDQGELKVLGLDPTLQGDALRRQCGVLTESAGLYPHISGRDNLLFFGRLYGSDDLDRCDELLDRFGLQEAKHRSVGTYSTGMKKRLGIARALLHRPTLLFLDEPTNGLDPEGARDLLTYIQYLNRDERVTVVVCTHLLRQVESLCHRYIFLHRGRLLEVGTLKELETKYLTDIKLALETDIPEASLREAGFTVLAAAAERTVLRIADRSQVPEVLRQVTALGSVYSAEILERDLETLYFKVRGEQA